LRIGHAPDSRLVVAQQRNDAVWQERNSFLLFDYLVGAGE
jgi:hypothetical protein